MEPEVKSFSFKELFGESNIDFIELTEEEKKELLTGKNVKTVDENGVETIVEDN